MATNVWLATAESLVRQMAWDHSSKTEWHLEIIVTGRTMFCTTTLLRDRVLVMRRSDILSPALPTLVTSRDKTRRLHDHLFDYLTYCLEVLFLRLSELVYTESNSRGLALVQTARSLVDHESLSL
jgi:hypothetical protein